MEFGILGPLRVVADDGEDVEVGGARRRALLLLLVLEANRFVSADLLVERLWEGEAPASASGTLQSHISHLRRAIGRDRIQTQGSSYRLVVHPGELDAHAFETELAEGRKLLAASDPLRAVSVATGALSRWRGPALADAGDADWVLAEAARLDELRLVGTEVLLESQLAAGRNAEVVAEAEAAIAAHPLRERLWAHLLVALYREGRQADALRAYQRLRAVLADELGIDPSPDLRALEGAILAQDPRLEPAPVEQASSEPSPLPSGVVTFLLTDVVGSTRLWESAPDAMAHALGRHDAAIQRAVEAHGGTFLKARGEGDSTFSVFARATDAVATARAMAMALEQEAWPDGMELVIRAALHTGEVLERDGDYYGRAVNRAGRLRAAAEPGQILLSRATADLVIDHLPDDVRLEELGTRALKDLEREETVFTLVGTEAEPPLPHVTPPDGVPFPSRLASTSTLRFVGRAQELEVLERRCKEAAAGEVRVVLVSGEPGMGKTALAAEADRSAHGDGAIVAYGRCDPDLGVPYLPWIEALEHLIACSPGERLSAVPLRALTDLARLVPSVSEVHRVQPASSGDADADRYRLFAAVTATMSAVAQEQPVVLILDDLHWADKPTLVLLRHVIGTISGKVLLVATYRPSDLTGGHPLSDLLADLRREPRADRVSLVGLAGDEIVDLVGALTGQAIGDAELGLVQLVRRETGGNPFFTLELLAHLVESGVVRRDEADRWAVVGDPDDVGLPESVREVIARRVAHVGDDAAPVLEVAAVIGRTFSVDVIEAVVDAAGDEVLTVLERAEAAALLTSTGQGEFSFAHALVGHALYEGIGATRRARLHGRVAEAMESRGLSDRRVNELARHWGEAARPTQVGKAIEYATAAGRQAMRALAPDEAVRWYAQALHLAEQADDVDDRQRCDLLIGVGRAQRDAGLGPWRETLLEAARLADRIGDGERLARAALANNRGLFSGFGLVDEERVAVLEASLDSFPPTDSPTRARLLATLAAELSFESDRRRRRTLTDQALAMARRVGDPSVLVPVLALRYSALWTTDMLEERRANIAEAREAAAATGNLMLMAWADAFGHLVAFESMDVDEADQLLDRYAAAVEELGSPYLQATALAYRASQAIRAGDVENATRFADAARSIARELGENEERAVSGVLFEVWRHEHRIDDIADYLDESGDSFVMAEPDSRGERARVAYHRADRQEATRLLDEGMSDGLLDHPDQYMWLSRASTWGEIAALLGARDHAVALYEALLPYRDRFGPAGHDIVVLTPHALGLLAVTLGLDDETVDGHFAEAVAMAERVRSVLHTARAQLAWGEALVGRARDADVRRGEGLLERALDIAERFGCAGVAADARRALASLRRRLPPALDDRSIFPFAGRTAERASLDAAWSAARQGRGGVVFVGGEPGVGKSRLVQELARAVHEEGGWVLHGRCDEELSAPYLPFRSVLDSLLERADDDLVDAHVTRCATDLAPLARGLASRAGSRPPARPEDADVERLRLFAAVQDLLDEASSRAPLLIVLDDLHWADASTLLLLRYLAVSDPAGRILLVVTYRDGAADVHTELASMLAALWREPGVNRLSLSGLGHDDVAAMMHGLAGHGIGAAGAKLATAITDRSSGNAFFVTELLRHVFEAGGATPGDNGRWTIASGFEAGGLPATVRDAVLNRLRRLGPAVEHLLSRAAVVGRQFDLALVSDVAELGTDDALDLVEQAIAGGLVLEVTGRPGRFTFAHALVVDALASTLTAARRVRIHARVAELLEVSGGSAAEIAHHSSAAGDAARALPWAVRAAEEATAAFAPAEAARWYRTALDLQRSTGGTDDATLFDLLFQLGRAQRDAGIADYRDTLLEAADVADRLGDARRLVRCALANTRGFGGFGRPDQQRIGVLRRAVATIGPVDTPERARLLATLALELRGGVDPAESRAVADEAMAMAQRLDDPATILRVLNLRYTALVAPETLDERLVETARAVDLAAQLGDLDGERWALNWRYQTLVEAFDVAAADACLTRMEEIRRQLRRPPTWHELFHRANRARLAGDLARAEAVGADARRLGLAFGGGWIPAGDIVDHTFMSGRLDTMVEALGDDPERNLSEVPAELAMAHWLLGHPDRARAVLDRTAASGYRGSAGLGYDVGYRCLWAITAVRLEATDHAAALLDLLRPWTGRAAFAGSPVMGAVDHHVGALARVLGRYDEASEHLGTAEAMHEGIGAHYWLAATRLERARLLLAAGDPAATDLARAVLDVAGARGYGLLEQEASELLADIW